MTALELRAKANEEASKADEILSRGRQEVPERLATDEEALEASKHTERAIQLLAQAKRQEAVEAITDELTQPQRRETTPQITDGSRIEIVDAPKLFRSLRAFKGPRAEERAYWSGQWLRYVLYGVEEARQACERRADRYGGPMTFHRDRASRGMVEGVNASGGFIVPDEFEKTIIDLREEYGVARRELRISPMASDHSNEPKAIGGLTAHWTGEGEEITESEKEFGNVELTAKKLAVLTRISNELNEDALINLADDLADDAAGAFAYAEDLACIDGDGTSTYGRITGIRTKMIDGSHTGSYVDGTSSSDNWSEITSAHLLSIQAAIKPVRVKRGAKWHCSPYAAVAVFGRLLQAAAGNTKTDLAGEAPKSYNGYPIVEWPTMPEDDASAALNNKIMFFFGNLRESSKMGVRRGITILRLLERYAERDQIGLRFTERCTINHHSITGKESTDRGPVCGFMGGT